MKKTYMLPLALGLALAGGNASAAFINGSVSFANGFSTLPSLPTTAIVSGQTSFDVGAIASGFGVSGDLAPGFGFLHTASDFDITNLPTAFFVTNNGFSFQLDSVSNVASTALACAAGTCADDIAFDVSGTVTAAGFDATEFSGTWTANGSCVGDAGECTSNITASWSASISVLGVAAPPPPTPTPGVPEPGVLALLGLGLMGTIGLRRRKQS